MLKVHGRTSHPGQPPCHLSIWSFRSRCGASAFAAGWSKWSAWEWGRLVGLARSGPGVTGPRTGALVSASSAVCLARSVVAVWARQLEVESESGQLAGPSHEVCMNDAAFPHPRRSVQTHAACIGIRSLWPRACVWTHATFSTSSRCRRAVSPYIWQDCKLAQALVILSRGWLVTAHSAVQCCLWELWLW